MADENIIRTVAEKCMGWQFIPAISKGPGTDDMLRFRPSDSCDVYWWPGCPGASHGWNPLSSISDAFRVVEKMRKRGFRYSMMDVPVEFGPAKNLELCYQVHFIKHNEAYKPVFLRSFADSDAVDISTDTRYFRGLASDTSPARAICLAAIAALEGK